MDYIWILIAFLCGFGVKQIGLPPLVGYLAAGFGLHAYGISPNENLETLANLGITLMLFTIGLKINVRDLFQREVWAGATIHMLIWSLFLCLIISAAAGISASVIFQLDWQTSLLIGFALSFSSTVCVIKALEEKGELKIRHGKLAIGILIIQDIAAVVFLVAATSKLPNMWALLLLGAWLIRPLLNRLLEHSGHGELLPLIGFFLALGAYELFVLMDLKGDLGALLIGMLLASHKKSTELYKSLIGFKDLFLIGFFLMIGFTALPTWETLLVAVGLTSLLVVKFIGFILLFNGFKLRGRTSFLAALALMNYSEFGLIVANYAVGNQWLDNQWLVILALSVTLSFIVSSFLYRDAHNMYSRQKSLINRLERKGETLDTCRKIPDGANVLIVGMGRVGSATYDALAPKHTGRIWGVDADDDRAQKHASHGRQVVLADAEDIDFWSCTNLQQVQLVMLAIPSVTDMKNIIQQLRFTHYDGRIAAIAQYEDDRQELEEIGADFVFSYFSEIGAGFAKESQHLIQPASASS